MSSYLQYLIWMMLFVIVIEMIFPDSSYRKYIKLVLGCILVYTLLRPIVSFVKVGGVTYDDYVKKYQMLLEMQNIEGYGYEAEKERQQETLKEVYQNSVKKSIEQSAEVEVVWLELKWDKDELTNIEATVTAPSDKIKIGEIRIGSKNEGVDGDEEKLKNKIKTCLSDFYNVQVQNIHITVQKN